MFLTTNLLETIGHNFIITRHYSKLPKFKGQTLVLPIKKPVGIRIYSKATLSKGWESKKIVPNVIDEVPIRRLTVEYPSVSIAEGNITKPKQTKDPPKVIWKVKEPNTYYSLCLTNPDAPKKEWLHWLVVNIPENNLEKGETLAEYVGPCPPKEGGTHRFIFLLFKQPTELSFSNEAKISKTDSSKKRSKFSIKQFGQKYMFGRPYAGNFCHAEYDDAVPEIWKQLGVTTL